MKIGEAVAQYTAQLQDERSGMDSRQAQQEAYWLLSHIAPKLKPYARKEGKLNSAQAMSFSTAVQRRAQGEPLAYILGEWDFYGDKYFINNDVLVPRVDTEPLVEWILKKFAHKKHMSFLEIGCGSGAVVISIAKRIAAQGWRFTAVDISKAALAITKINSLHHKCEIKLYRSDIVSAIPSAHKFDIVFANLPYVETPWLLSARNLKDEPRLALDGGSDGMDILKRCCLRLRKNLKKNAWLILEHGHKQSHKIAKSIKGQGYVHKASIKDMQGHTRGIALLYP